MFYDYSVYGSLLDYDEHTLYDVNILLPVHLAGKYLRRLQVFKKCGLYNLRNLKVHLSILGSRGDWKHRHELVQGWPEGVRTTFLEMGNHFAVPKINGYYLWLRQSGLRARWLLRVDDDSVTDIGKLIAAADTAHGDAAMHVMTSPLDAHTQHAPHIRQYLDEHGIEVTDYRHEHESSLTSQAALDIIFANTQVINFLQTMAGTAQRFGDQCLAYAMHIAGVPVADNPVSTKDCLTDSLSIVGGPLCHVHYVDWEKLSFALLLEAMIHGRRMPVDHDTLCRVQERPLAFGRGLGTELADLVLRPDGEIEGAFHPNESRWRWRENVLCFFDTAGAPATQFSTRLELGRRTWLLGTHLADSAAHYLRLS